MMPAATSIMLGTIVRDTNIIIQTARKMGWNVDLVGQFASYDTAVATLPGGATEGFYCMTPALYAYPDDPRPAVQEFAKRYKAQIRPRSELPWRGRLYRRAQLVLIGLQKAGKDLTVGQLHQGDGEHPRLQGHFRLRAVVRTGPASWLDPVVPDGREERALGAGGGGRAVLLSALSC